MINMMELKERLRFANKEELYYDFKSSFAPITSLHIALKMLLFHGNVCRGAHFSLI